MNKTIAILWYMPDHFGGKRWELVRKTTWAEYLVYCKEVSGEGTSWKAIII